MLTSNKNLYIIVLSLNIIICRFSQDKIPKHDDSSTRKAGLKFEIFPESWKKMPKYKPPPLARIHEVKSAFALSQPSSFKLPVIPRQTRLVQSLKENRHPTFESTSTDSETTDTSSNLLLRRNLNMYLF